MFDHLKDIMINIVNTPSLIHNKTIVMNLFDKFKNKLPLFIKYFSNLYDVKSTTLFGVTAKIVPLGELWHKLFHPRDLYNKKSTAMMVELSKISTNWWVVEMINKKEDT
jgi:hypothetical protein